MSAILTLANLYYVLGALILGFALLTVLDANHPKRWGTAAFWGLLGAIVAFGGLVPPEAVGAGIVALALLAAFNANRISSRLGVGRTIIGASIVGGPMTLLIAFAPHGNAALALLIPVLAVGGLANVIYNVTQVSLRQAITPERLQGRMNSVMRFIVWGTIPLGAIVGGVLASRIGVRETVIIGGIGCWLPFLPVLFSAVRSIREMPEPLQDQATAVLGPLVGDAGPVAVEHVGA